MANIFNWIHSNEVIIVCIAVFSVVFFIAALLVLPWAVVRIPADYFAGNKRPRKGKRSCPYAVLLLLKIINNIIGGIFVVTGIVMLVTPGQGVLTIIAGLMLMNFPGKFKLERWVVSRGFTLKFINRMRRKKGRPPLILGDDSSSVDSESGFN